MSFFLSFLLAHPIEGSAEAEILKPVQFIVEIAFIGNDPHDRLGFFRPVRYIDAVDSDRSGTRSGQADDHVDCGCLSGAVRPQEAEQLSFPYVEGDVIHCGDLAISLRQVRNLDHLNVPYSGLNRDRIP